MHIEERIRDDADLVVNAKIIIHLGSLIPSNLIASHVTFVIALDNLLPPNPGSSFYLFCESHSPVETSHDFLLVEAPVVTRVTGVSSERSDSVSPPVSGPVTGGVTLLGPKWR
jgi:hypothetical protein